jgi:hypothetical protein
MLANQERIAVKLVWYASYGSNLKLERFICYIKGGRPRGSAKLYLGCRDKRDPIESRPIPLNFELYFAGRSNAWPRREKDGDVPGGIAFIRQNPERGPTLGRVYLITDEQFNDVVLQENAKQPDGNRYVPPFEQLVSQREVPLNGDPLYGKILNIGSQGGSPILTFTTGRDLTLNEPSESYLKEIAAGIRETYAQMSDDDITEYLLQADGVRGKIDLAKIRDWVAAA